MAAQRLQFEHFEISTDELGSPIRLGPGGMGTTFKAYDTRLRKLVALKIINERLLADASSRRRFFNEARAAALIDHPNVARVLYLCPEQADECFFAMELVEGESLANRVARYGPLPAGEALLLLRAVADALTALGEHRLVHRDIKPDNIMIARAGKNAARVKLIDFGLAKALEHAPERFESVHTGERFVGSVYFASPEQIRPRGALDSRSDFYSLGATLWQVLTGFPPFTGTVFEVQEGHVYHEPPWEKIVGVPVPIHTLLHRLLAKDPAQRPADAETLLTEWDAAIAGLETCKSVAEPPSVRAEHAPPVDDMPPTTVHQVTLVAVRFEQAPTGCALPVPPGQLARDAASGDWLVVRGVPERFAPELRAEFFAASQAAADAPHAGLLNVREVRTAEVLSEWNPAVTATQLLARQRGALPVDVVLAWLPKVAEAVDWAREHGFARIGLAPARWLVSFEALAGDEKPLDRAGLPPDGWGAHYLHLDPLAGFDAELAGAETAAGHTEISARQPPLVTPADFLAALARAIYELLGGRSRERPAALPALDEPRNELLLAALAGRSTFTTVRAWAATFAARGAPAAAAVPKKRRFATAEGKNSPPSAAAVENRRSLGQPPPAPVASPLPPPALAVHGAAATPARSRMPLAWGALAAVALAAGTAYYFAGRDGAPRRPEPPLPPPVASPVAVEDGAARRPYLAATPLPKPAPVTPRVQTPTPAPKPPPRAVDLLASATKDAPFINTLGMEFVPVPGTSVLFCRWETRVKDYRAFAEATQHAVEKPGFVQTDDHPAVNVSWEDAKAFCGWLSKKEGREYRLPTDEEWSVAVGLPRETGATPSDKSMKIADVFPWGAQWPPPKGAGNYAGEETTDSSKISGYNDGYKDTAPAGSFMANRFGIHDLGGNVWEWCEDWYDAKQTSRVLRGGSFDDGVPGLLLSSYRFFQPTFRGDFRGDFRGFRVVVVGASSAR